jgi:hypothetical protein
MPAKPPPPPVANWIDAHSKHVVILSHAGKPVFSRYPYGDSGMAVIALIRGLAAKTQDQLRSLRSPSFCLVVLVKPHLILACVSKTREPVSYQRDLLELLYHHVIFHVTLPALGQLFSSNPGYDLGALLGGTQTEALGLIRGAHYDLNLLLRAIPARRCANRHRLGELLEMASKPVAHFGVVMGLHDLGVLALYSAGKQAKLDPMDYLLLANFVKHAPQLRNDAKTWTPLCLPKFNASGHLQAYAAPLAGMDLVLLLLTLDSSLDTFHLCSERHAILHDALVVNGMSDGVPPAARAWPHSTLPKPWPWRACIAKKRRFCWWVAAAVRQAQAQAQAQAQDWWWRRPRQGRIW